MNPFSCNQFSSPYSRRDALKTFGLGFGGLALSSLFGETARAAVTAAGPGIGAGNPLAPRAPHFVGKAKRVIFLFMHGGPSSVDTFDHKPALEKHDGQTAPNLPKITFAAANGRDGSKLWKSPWKFSPRGESGHMVSELFPHLGGHVDEMCFLHSCHGTALDHGAAVLRMSTGTEAFVRPSLGSWMLYGLGSENQDLPGFITIAPSDTHGGVRNYGSAFLPAAYQGTALGSAASKADEAKFRFLGKPGDALQRRQLDFLREINLNSGTPVDSELEARIGTYELAFRMQMAAPEVMDISKESAATRELYGIDDPVTAEFGKKCLLARRFAEAGVRFIQISTGAVWDQHGGLVKGHGDNARASDKPAAGLLKDLKQRGLLDDTLVIWGGEFGRTPTREGGDGRDHNPHGYTMWLAGGGVKPGRVGATDELGYYAVENKIHLHDLHATLLALMGLDHERLTYRYAGRDFRLTDVFGRVVKEVFA
ncbi:DUF1501 domain-containing protein [Luteolibacter sp. SL250]|uniref:DUF1501 domain-containing protein n=1 Tax=Luteolibacter sp. SL250 TaxID=2995170 RepID=UPI00226DF4DE|nr:DUF1501 domain-containing protein [Luteolibacter sp. SL250]WAC18052.1 DUF1501 domain-containing protein [Luteolibacter sp. SL250]